MIQPEMKLIAGVISLQSSWQKWNSISGDKISWKRYLKWNCMNGNICTCVNKNDWHLFNELFISDHIRNEIHFISPTILRNVNRISFTVGWNFVSGRFHFRSHENTPQENVVINLQMCCSYINRVCKVLTPAINFAIWLDQ